MPPVKALAEPLTVTTIKLYTDIAESFLPTPEKCHYLFNLRDVSKVFQDPALASQTSGFGGLPSHPHARLAVTVSTAAAIAIVAADTPCTV